LATTAKLFSILSLILKSASSKGNKYSLAFSSIFLKISGAAKFLKDDPARLLTSPASEGALT
jgi:hypothetical protein